MRRALIGAVLAATGVMVARKLGPRLCERCEAGAVGCSSGCPTTFRPSG